MDVSGLCHVEKLDKFAWKGQSSEGTVSLVEVHEKYLTITYVLPLRDSVVQSSEPGSGKISIGTRIKANGVPEREQRWPRYYDPPFL